MASLYTHGSWRVRPGKEEDFIAAWRDLAEWALAEIEGSKGARLMQDRDEPTRFYTMGPWDSPDAIQRFREHTGFSERMARIRETTEEAAIHTLEVRLEIGNP